MVTDRYLRIASANDNYDYSGYGNEVAQYVQCHGNQGTIPEPSTSHIGREVALVARTVALVHIAQNLSDSRNGQHHLRNMQRPERGGRFSRSSMDDRCY